MKKIGKEVLFIEADKHSCRLGEGSFIRRKDSSIMFSFSDFCGSDWHDHCEAVISAVFSYDEGETWQDKKIIVRKSEGAENVMSASLLRMNNGDIGLFYGEKLIRDSVVYDRVLLVRSSDEGETWSEPYVVIPPDSYFCLCNDRACILKSGRIIFPASEHKHLFAKDRPIGDDRPDNWRPGNISAFYSDDDGITWKRSEIVYPPFSNDPNGFAEPGIIEREDGTIHMYTRTTLGFQYECFSDDGGETWSKIMPNRTFVSPDSPMLIKRIDKKRTVGVFNPIARPSACLMFQGSHWNILGRTPFVCALSEDDDQTYTKFFYLEDDITNDYCYPAVIEGKDYFLVAYYHSNNTGIPLNSLKITKVSFSELGL